MILPSMLGMKLGTGIGKGVTDGTRKAEAGLDDLKSEKTRQPERARPASAGNGLTLAISSKR